MNAKLTPEAWRSSIPLGMRALNRWIGHRAKKPLDLRTGGSASVTDQTSWGTFDDAMAFYSKTMKDPDVGIGFVFREGDGLTFIDLDHIFAGQRYTPDGAVLLEELRDALGGITRETYCERSPSDTGLHVFAIGQLPPDVRHVLRHGNAAVEVYDRVHFSTVTGRIPGGLQAKPLQLARVQDRLDKLVAHIGRLNSGPSEPSHPEPERELEVVSALGALNPDMPYAEWLKVGMSIKAGLGEAGRDLWVGWSRQGSKYKPGEPEEKWASFRRAGVGLGSLFYEARQAGWTGDGPAKSLEETFAEFKEEDMKLAAQSGEPPQASENDGFKLVPLSEVKREHIDWLWKGRIALGHVTLVAGDPGLGKSIVTLDIASRLSKGLPLPEEVVPRACTVFVLNAEDGQADTLRPRAEAAGADLTKVLVMDLLHNGRIPQLPDDIAKLEKLIEQAGDVNLVILDPLNAFLPVKLDSYKDQHVRQALAPLAALAQRKHIAIVLVVHLNKANDTVSALYRVSGSIGIGAAARSVLFVGPHPDDDTLRVVAQAKPQLGPPPPALAFTVVESKMDKEVGVVEWRGEVDVRANDLVAKQEPADQHASRLEQAKQWLSMFLAGGPQLASDVLAGGKLMHFGEKTLRRAHDLLGGKRVKNGMTGGWVWEPPPKFAEMKDAV